MISVLNIVTSIHVGGVSTLLLEYLKRSDLSNNQIDILAIDLGYSQLFENDFKKIGVNVYYMPKSYFKRLFFLFKFLIHRKYDIVHSHIELASAIYLFIAYLCGVKRRIAHAHMAFLSYSSIKDKCLQFLLNQVATDKCGCTRDAILNLFGNDKNSYVLRNAINTSVFQYNQIYRDEIRNKLGVSSKFVIGFVGRFTSQKAPLRLLDILQKSIKYRNDVVLVTVGDGELFDEFVAKTKDLNLECNVINEGKQKDVFKYMSAFDCLLLPSLYEGLGIVLIEAQAASLHCVTTEEFVPKDTNITPYISYVSWNADDSQWAKAIFENTDTLERKDMTSEIIEAGYDIESEAHSLFDFYNNKNDKKCCNC